MPILANSSPPMPDDVRDVHQRLDVVDQRRALVEALERGERRLQARVAALALERVEQRGLLAADVGAGAAVDDQVERVVGAEDALAEVARRARLGERGVEDVGLVLVLAADVDEGAVDARRPRRDDHALDQQVRVLLHQLAVLEGARARTRRRCRRGTCPSSPLGRKDDLLAHREAGAAAAAHARGLELGEHVLGRPSSAPACSSRSRRPSRRPSSVLRPGTVDVLEEQLHDPGSSSGSVLARAGACAAACRAATSRPSQQVAHDRLAVVRSSAGRRTRR